MIVVIGFRLNSRDLIRIASVTRGEEWKKKALADEDEYAEMAYTYTKELAEANNCGMTVLDIDDDAGPQKENPDFFLLMRLEKCFDFKWEGDVIRYAAVEFDGREADQRALDLLMYCGFTKEEALGKWETLPWGCLPYLSTHGDVYW